MSAEPLNRRLQIEENGDITLVRFTDRGLLNEQTIQEIGKELYRLVDDQGRKKILLSFGNAEYFPSLLLGKITTLNKKAQAAGGKLVLCDLGELADDLPSVVRRFLEIVENEQAANEAFAKP
jgi:anti-sigma B factor antagonist